MKATGQGLIALLTDFGTRDWYVATLKGVVLSRFPQARFVDITHEVPPQDVLAGAFTLAAACPWFPPGTTFLAIVDPGVGTSRALIAARAHGRYFVGPDNGLLALSLQQANHPQLIRLTKHRYWLTALSQTFHGRDILAPVAAPLAAGGAIARLGEPMVRLAPLALPPLRRERKRLRGAIVHIDTFGNAITNVRPAALPPQPRDVVFRYQQRKVRMVSSYADGRPNELIALVGSLGFVELAIRNGSAARTLHAKRGDPVEVVV